MLGKDIVRLLNNYLQAMQRGLEGFLLRAIASRSDRFNYLERQHDKVLLE